MITNKVDGYMQQSKESDAKESNSSNLFITLKPSCENEEKRQKNTF